MASSARCSSRSSCVSAGTPSAPHSQWGHLCPLCQREPPQLHTASGATCVRCVGGNPLSSTQPVGPLVSAVSAGTPSAPHSQWGHLCPLCQREPPQLHTASSVQVGPLVSAVSAGTPSAPHSQWGHLCLLCQREPPPPTPHSLSST